jgi:hypothetical protein
MRKVRAKSVTCQRAEIDVDRAAMLAALHEATGGVEVDIPDEDMAAMLAAFREAVGLTGEAPTMVLNSPSR